MSSVAHQRAPRTPESYFNVPESIALLNIVKSERIQCAFQSNRKNHASVWEMVANILNKYSNRKRSSKQCCNRYENLKKIYTQLKRNPERHVRRNWPYMYLFREIEEQRGESWGSSGKRAANNLLASALSGEVLEPIGIPDMGEVDSGNMMNGNHGGGQNLSTSNIKTQIKNELSFYQKRKNMAALTSMLMNREVMLTNINNNDNSESDRLMANNFVETELNDVDDNNDDDDDGDDEDDVNNGGNINQNGIHDNNNIAGINNHVGTIDLSMFGLRPVHNHLGNNNINGNVNGKKRNIQEFGLPDFLSNIKDEPIYESDQESSHESDKSLYLRTNNTSGHQEFFMNGLNSSNNNNNNSNNCNNETNILHPDVIVDTDHVTDSSNISGETLNNNTNNSNNNNNSNKKRRKSSTSTTDGGESTNYELIEYLRRREKRDEEMYKRMNEREDRLLNLLERTVAAFESIASQNNNSTHNNNVCSLNSNVNNSNGNSNNNNSSNTGNNNNSNESLLKIINVATINKNIKQDNNIM